MQNKNKAIYLVSWINKQASSSFDNITIRQTQKYQPLGACYGIQLSHLCIRLPRRTWQPSSPHPSSRGWLVFSHSHSQLSSSGQWMWGREYFIISRQRGTQVVHVVCNSHTDVYYTLQTALCYWTDKQFISFIENISSLIFLELMTKKNDLCQFGIVIKSRGL